MIEVFTANTPNGIKVPIALEELGVPYELRIIALGSPDLRSVEYLAINPNAKIPAIRHLNGSDGPVTVFESGAILLYLADKFGKFLPASGPERTEALNWLFWLQGAAPYLGGGFGHFYAYAPEKYEYPINRFAMEVKRQLHLLDTRLGETRYLGGDTYTIADIVTWPWYGNLVLGEAYGAAEFLQVQEYQNVMRWAKEIAARPAVKRGRIVNRISGPLEEQLHERHDASDFELRTQDKIGG